MSQKTRGRFYCLIAKNTVDSCETMCYNSVTVCFRRLIMAAEAKEKTKILEYKGHPLRRKDNLIYYGSMSDKYIIMLQVVETKTHEDLNIASRILVQLQFTDPDLKSRDRVVKKSEKTSFFEAIDVAAVWLERALATG